jgi:hypothetical protein
MKTMHEVLNDLIEYKVVLEKANKIIHGLFRGVQDQWHSVHNDTEVLGSGSNPLRLSLSHRYWYNYFLKVLGHLKVKKVKMILDHLGLNKALGKYQ